MEDPEKFHCVTQLQRDSWEYREKRPGDEPNEDDLVSWDDYLKLHDRLTLEVQALDKRRVAEAERVSKLTYALQESLKLQAHYGDLLNMYDGGQRKLFPSVEAWLAQLRVG